MVLSTRIFIETLKDDDMMLIISLTFFSPEYFACSAERKSENPDFFQYANKLVSYLLRLPRRKENRRIEKEGCFLLYS